MNQVTIVLLVFAPLVALSIWLIWFGVRKESERRTQQEEWRKQQAEQRRQQKQIRAERQARQERIKDATAALTEQLTMMEEWDEWPEELHAQPEQTARIRRALEENIRIMAYDPRYALAKVRSGSGHDYLTGPRCCNCPDFRKRHLPCKHMYKLALYLDGDTAKQLIDVEHEPLYALYFVLAGHFPNDGLDIKRRLLAKHGIPQTDITGESSILLCGTHPSQNKMLYFEYHNLPILQPDDIDKLFQPSKVSLVKEGK